MGTRWAAALAVLALAGVARADPGDRGFFFGGELGPALVPTLGDTPGQTDPHFNLRLGARFATGASMAFDYDNLGLHPHQAGMPLQLLTIEARYTFVNLDPCPFAEARAGPALVKADEALSPGGGSLELDLAGEVGGGVWWQPFEHVSAELGGRMFVVQVTSSVVLAFTVDLGVELDFAKP